MGKGRKCCVPYCQSSQLKSDGNTFHEIPCQEDRRKLWLNNISRRDNLSSKPWTPADRSVVCSRHFTENDYVDGGKCKRLKREAVPTVFPEYPKYKQPQLKKERLSSQRVCNRTPLAVKEKNKSPLSQNLTENEMNTESFCPEIENRENLPSVHPPSELINQKDKLILAFKKRVSELQVKVDNLQEKLANAHRRLNYKQRTIKSLSLKISTTVPDKHQVLLQKIKDEAAKGDPKAEMIVEQVEAFGKKKFKWSEFYTRLCILWRSKAPRSYNFARKHLFNLPSQTTLQRYIGPSSLQTGLTDLALLRLKEEFNHISDTEKYCSIIFDEMAIQPRVQYRKQADKIVGYATIGNNKKGSPSPIANKLLCFVLKGSTTNYRIPVAYYLVKQLTGEDLSKLLLDVVEKIEEIGFYVCRLVCDDASVNVKALQIICNGELKSKIAHPFREDSPLFISFDPCHIIKNVRNQFLDDDRNLTLNGKPISSKPIKILYKNQQNLAIKPVRNLSRKTVYPTNFEKMHVGRACLIFSTPLIAAIEFCMVKNMPGFRNIEESITFMKTINKWFDIHNICNRTHYVACRNDNKKEFSLVDDERLKWLEEDFLGYLETWRSYAETQPKDKKTRKTQTFLTKATYTALKITTLSTVECIRYLLTSGVQFVLTRKFTSDDVEGIFSAVRSSQGYNDQANAVGSIYALERILKTGLFSINGFSNSSSSSNDTIESAFKQKNVTNGVKPTPSSVYLSSQQRTLIQKLSNPPGIQNTTVKNAGMAMVAGFMLRLLKDKHDCPQAVDSFVGDKEASSNALISLQDRGGLMYPSESFIGIVNLLINILELSSHNENRSALVASWSTTLLCNLPPNVLNCSCGNEDHTVKLRKLIMESLCKIYFNNVCYEVTDSISKPVKTSQDTLSKKMKKVN